jgi:hypothetical protein
VGDKKDRRLELRPNPQQDIFELQTGQRVERAEWLIHQQDFRLVRECPGDGDALLHAAGKLPRIMAFEPFEADQLDQRFETPFLRRPPSDHAAPPARNARCREPNARRRAIYYILETAGPNSPAARRRIAVDDDSPRRRRQKPAIDMSSVVLPQPEGPTNETNSPASTWQVILPMATVVSPPA